MAAPPLPTGDLSLIPAAPAPSPLVSNLVDPVSNGKVGTVFCSIFIAIATIAVVLRLYVRLVIRYAPGWDDLSMVIALILQITVTGVTIDLCARGLVGKHIWDTPLSAVIGPLPYVAKLQGVIAEPAYFFTKLAILLLYYRLFAPNKLVRWGIYVGVVCNFLIYTSFMFVFIYVPVMNDVAGVRLADAIAIYNVLSDVYLFILPMFAVSTLHMAPRKKLGLVAIFLTGLAAIAMSILTLYFRYQYTGSGPDPTYDATVRVTVSTLEIDIGIICGCMPLFANFFKSSSGKSSWFTSLRSLRSRLLRSHKSKFSVPNSHAASPSAEGNGQVGSEYLELKESRGFATDGVASSAASNGEEVAASNASSKSNRDNGSTKAGRREWFDQETATRSLA